jgi:hydrogenase maturation protease
MMMTHSILVLGLGNLLLQDEGLGVHALEQLAALGPQSPEIELLDGGTLGLELLPRIEGATHLLILDAVRTGALPGTLVRLEGDAIPAALAHKVSPHQVGLQELLAVAAFRGALPAERVLLGLEPASLDWGTELTPEVADSMSALVGAAIEQLRAWSGADAWRDAWRPLPPSPPHAAPGP